LDTVNIKINLKRFQILFLFSKILKLVQVEIYGDQLVQDESL